MTCAPRRIPDMLQAEACPEQPNQRMWAVEALKEWHDFYVLVGTAGATLLALLFVAVCGARATTPSLHAPRSSETV